MEEDGIQAQACKFPRAIGNGIRNVESNKGTEGNSDGSTNLFHNSWHHHSSRIVRVSRASGGKDRHSKVMTSKGLRDRRVRLSVATAIQFYDLQDRLGYDQPSKAVEWLIKAAADAISELPSLKNTFPESPKQNISENEKRVSLGGTEQGFDEVDGESNYHNQNNQSQNLPLSKSACSSNSETSKGSGGLSLSRSEIRVKARERARERAKEKEKDNNEESRNNINIAHHLNQQQNVMSQTASFTELLTGEIGGNTSAVLNSSTSPNGGSVHQNHEITRQQWCSSTTVPMEMDYFQLGNSNNSLSLPHQVSLPFNNVSGENHFSFIPHDQLMPTHHHVVTSSHSHQNDYNLNFTISSSGLAGYNSSRGTLQSNSPNPSLLQRFSSPLDGSNNAPFFIGAGAAPTPMDNHHHQIQFSPVFDGRGLQLSYGDGTRHSDHKGKAKN